MILTDTPLREVVKLLKYLFLGAKVAGRNLSCDWLRPAVTVDARGAYLLRRRARTVFVGHGSRSMS